MKQSRRIGNQVSNPIGNYPKFFTISFPHETAVIGNFASGSPLTLEIVPYKAVVESLTTEQL
jgi:hypothetical protein